MNYFQKYINKDIEQRNYKLNPEDMLELKLELKKLI